MTNPIQTGDSKTARTFYLALGRILSTGLGVVSLAVLSRWLDKSEYATYRQALQIWTVASPLLLFGLPEALYSILPRAAGRQRGAVLESLSLLVISGLLFAAFLGLGGIRSIVAGMNEPGPGLAVALAWLAPFVGLSLLAEAVTPIMVVAGNTRQLALFQIFSRGLAVALSLAVVALWRPTGVAAVAGLNLAAVITAAVALPLVSTVFADHSRPTFAGMREQLRCALPLGAGAVLAGWLFSYDKVVVAVLSSREDFALFANGAWEIPLVGILAGSATAVLWPEMTRLRDAGHLTDMLHLWQRAAIKSASVSFPLLIFGWLLADEIIVALYSSSYANSAAIFRVYLWLILVRIAPWTVVPQAARRPWPVLSVTAAGLLGMMATSPFAVRMFGPIGAAWALVVVTMLVLVPGYGWLTAQILGVPLLALPPWRGLLRNIFLSALPGLLLGAKFWLPWPPLAILTISAAVYFPLCYWLLTRFGDGPKWPLLERWLAHRGV